MSEHNTYTTDSPQRQTDDQQPDNNHTVDEQDTERKELFINLSESGKVPRIVNNRDPELQPVDPIDISSLDKLLFERLHAMLDFTKVGQFYIVSELLRYHHGEITLKECNERIYDIEKVSVEVLGKRTGSWFTRSDGGALSTHVWYGNVGAETPKQTPALPSPESKYLESAISAILEESEIADMAVRVFICDECECGTSYCAKVVDKEAGRWICNFCSHDNGFQRNRYFIYNKAELGINSFLRYGGRSVIIQLDNYFWKTPKANRKLKLNYSDSKKQPRENDFMFSGSPYASSIYAHPVMRSLSSGKVEIDVKKKYFSHEVFNLILCCEEVAFDDKTVYVFYFKPYQFGSSDCGLYSETYRLMILPAFDQLKGEFPVDELLAVMCDNLNNLTFCGVKIATSKRGDTKHYSVNFLNFSCREDLLKVFRNRVKKTKLTHLANTEQYLVPDFDSVLYGTIGRLVLDSCFKTLSPRAKMFLENELIKRKRETQIPKHCRNFNECYVVSSSQFPRPDIPDKVTDLRVDSLTNQDIRFIIITIIDSQEKSLKSSIRPKHLKILGDIRVLLQGGTRNFNYDDIERRGNDIVDCFAEFCRQEGVKFEKGKVELLRDILHHYYYFGDLQYFNYEWLWPVEKHILKSCLSHDTNVNILNSLNKSQVLFHNYMNILQRFYLLYVDELEVASRLSSDLKESIARYRKPLLRLMDSRKGSFQDLYAHIHSSHPSGVEGCVLSIQNRDHTSLKEFGKKILECAGVNSFKPTMENPYIFYQRMISGLSKLGTESMRNN